MQAAVPRNPAMSGRCVERTQQERAVLGREPAVDLQRAALAPEQPEMRALLHLRRLRGRHPPVGPHRPLQLGRRHQSRKAKELLLALGIRDPRQRAHLREGELPGRERRVHAWELTQISRHAHMLARRPGRQRAPPGEPSSTRAHPRLRPVAATIDLGDDLEPATRPGKQVRRQGRRLVLELPESQPVGIICCHNSKHSIGAVGRPSPAQVGRKKSSCSPDEPQVE